MNSSQRKFALYLGPHLIGYAHAPETLPPTAYFCENCGEIWGRAVPVGAAAEETWRFHPKHCSRHPLPAFWWETAGSFTQTGWLGFADFDRDVLVYELEREIERNRYGIPV